MRFRTSKSAMDIRASFIQPKRVRLVSFDVTRHAATQRRAAITLFQIGIFVVFRLACDMVKL